MTSFARETDVAESDARRHFELALSLSAAVAAGEHSQACGNNTGSGGPELERTKVSGIKCAAISDAKAHRARAAALARVRAHKKRHHRTNGSGSAVKRLQVVCDNKDAVDERRARPQSARGVACSRKAGNAAKFRAAADNAQLRERLSRLRRNTARPPTNSSHSKGTVNNAVVAERGNDEASDSIGLHATNVKIKPMAENKSIAAAKARRAPANAKDVVGATGGIDRATSLTHTLSIAQAHQLLRQVHPAFAVPARGKRTSTQETSALAVAARTPVLSATGQGSETARAPERAFQANAGRVRACQRDEAQERGVRDPDITLRAKAAEQVKREAEAKAGRVAKQKARRESAQAFRTVRMEHSDRRQVTAIKCDESDTKNGCMVDNKVQTKARCEVKARHETADQANVQHAAEDKANVQHAADGEANIEAKGYTQKQIHDGTREQAEYQANEQARREIETLTPQEMAGQTKHEAKEQVRREAEKQAAREAAEQAKRVAQEQAKREAQEQAKREAQEQAKREAQERAQRDAEEQAAREAAEQAKHEAEEQVQREAEEKAAREAAKQAKREAQERAHREAEEKAAREAAEQATREAQERAHREAEEKAAREAAEQAKREAQERAHREAEAQAAREAAEQAKREAQERAHREAEAQAARKAAEQAKREALERAQREAEEKAAREAAELMQLKIDEQARHKSEERQACEVQEWAKRKTEEEAKREVEEQMPRVADEHAKRTAQKPVPREAEERAKRLAEERKVLEAEKQTKPATQEQVQREVEEHAEYEAQNKAKCKSDAKGRRGAKDKAKHEADEKAKRTEEKAKVKVKTGHGTEERAQAHGDAGKHSKRPVEKETIAKCNLEDGVKASCETEEKSKRRAGQEVEAGRDSSPAVRRKQNAEGADQRGAILHRQPRREQHVARRSGRDKGWGDADVAPAPVASAVRAPAAMSYASALRGRTPSVVGAVASAVCANGGSAVAANECASRHGNDSSGKGSGSRGRRRRRRSRSQRAKTTHVSVPVCTTDGGKGGGGGGGGGNC
eukprot:g1444.t1